ncbi:MAG: hypothetical protein HY060_12160 [Proteobacteria bacterium]|nr:hypothetical protein [Pseudomonadota bacterium]
MLQSRRSSRRLPEWLAGAALLAMAAAASAPATAQGPVCRNGNEVFQPGQTMCLDGFTNTCQANGAWVSDRQWPCMEPVFNTAAKSCPIRANRSAAPGARACIDGKRRECGESGTWVDLGVRC